MKRKYLLVLLVLPALILLITSSGVSGVNEEDNTISFDENLVEPCPHNNAVYEL